MKYLDILKEKNIFNFEENKIEIENVEVIPSKKTITLYLNFDKALRFNEYEEFIQKNQTFFKSLNMMPKFFITYKINEFIEEDFNEYFKGIVDNLCKQIPSFNSVLDYQKQFKENEFILLVDEINNNIIEQCQTISSTFLEYSLDVSVKPKVCENVKTVEQIQKEIIEKEKESLSKKQEYAKETSAKAEIVLNNNKVKTNLREKSKINEIPVTQDDLFIYSNKVGQPIFLIEGEVFGVEVRKLKKASLATIKLTDNNDSIVVKKWLRTEKEVENFNEFAKGDILLIEGIADYDTYARNVLLNANSISYVGKKQEDEIIDDAPIKRVELHTHTKMSNLDGITTAEDYIRQAVKWGHKAMAFTDHNGVYAIPDIYKECKKLDFKPIYGVEMNYIDDTIDYKIAFTNEDIELRKASYVVFDIETTGFSQENDRLIEIAAVKVYQGGIIDTFSTFINPEKEISLKITEITSITNEMVKDAPKINEVLPQFLEFCKGCILVAHNASFDVGMIYANMRRLNIPQYEYPVIDTLNLLRAIYNKDLKKFNLKAMAKYFKVKQEHHHRAIDDTKVTAECFLYMLQDIYKNQINNYNEINTLAKTDEMFKFVIPSHINILVKNQTGYKNMFKIISDALTVHCYDDGRLLKSVLETHREGLLVGSGCVNGVVFENALNRSLGELKEAISYCDYIEVQPPQGYLHLINDIPNGEEVIQKTIKKIISVAKEMNKMVVATSDCHYLRPAMKNYRDILIGSMQVGGGLHDLARYEKSPHMHFRTTNEMLKEFSFLEDNELINEIVIVNTNKIADSIDKIQCFSKEMYSPKDDEFKEKLGIESIPEEVRRIVKLNCEKMYGTNPHEIVTKRLDRELESIISNGFASVYYMSHLLVTKSLEDGYLVGSRGSVGSSIVATMMNITEINPLSPHYRCKKCHFTSFKMNEEEKTIYYSSLTKEQMSFQKDLDLVESGYDLPDATCPICGEKLTKDGHDIPFETFLGFNGDKVPDIDLNFSGEYQAIAHEYVRDLLGNDNAFRGGTVGTNADKNAYGYVKAYIEKKNINLRSVEIERIAEKIVGVKRSTGQHPGGIVVVPKHKDIYDVTPFQYPADNIDNAWRTTHFDYHAFEDNLLKLDILGHDDPTMIKFLMDYVNEHQSEFSFDNAQDIPIDDKNVYRLFCGTDIVNIKEDQIESKVASFAVPEFGTNFVRQMLSDTLPQSFAQLVKISGLSHGTDVWLNNAQDLVLGKTEHGPIAFKDVIGCRDDIMVYLIYQGLEPYKAFEIMEFVRRGKPSKDTDKWNEYKDYMRSKGIKEWYIWSCEQIKYMFPKAHATAYVLMALRIAWFKVYAPKLFYSAYFSKRAKAHHVRAFIAGPFDIKQEIQNLSTKPDQTAKDEDTITSLQVALEMTLRGIKFLPVDIEKSDSLNYTIEDEGLRIPFVACDGLGEAVAIDIVERRKEQAFTSKEDIFKRTRLNKTLFEEFEKMGAFKDLSDKDKEEELGIFAFVD